jgi:hypothetical protein
VACLVVVPSPSLLPRRQELLHDFARGALDVYPTSHPQDVFTATHGSSDRHSPRMLQPHIHALRRKQLLSRPGTSRGRDKKFWVYLYVELHLNISISTRSSSYKNAKDSGKCVDRQRCARRFWFFSV